MNKYFPITHYEAVRQANFAMSMLDDFQIVIDMMGKEPTDFLTFADRFVSSIAITKTSISKYPEDNFAMSVRMVYHMWRLWANGERMYYVSRDLCEMLLHTDLTLDASFIQSPFEEIYLYTDQDELKISDYTGILPVKGVYVNLRAESDGKRRLRFLATSGAEGIEEQLDINHYACFIIPDHGRMEDIVNRQLEYFIEQKNVNNDQRQVDLVSIATIFKWVVNLLLYITSKNADLAPVQPKVKMPKSEKKARKMRNKTQLPFIYVGGRVKRPAGPTNIGSGAKITHKFWVSGHWRAQWKGSVKDSSRHQERIWIKPYSKGDDLAESLSKTYIVKEPE